ncbi:MAG: hypothetical protein CUN56_01205 [Phototrophicales bacterium]|nr:MAG: hypothetical protein CUN56_01205 [Phototrophicales bacterium]RMG72389.1 MAG: class I SAM-dependent RNA methyltransferase [Chloroflexota bacterium]
MSDKLFKLELLTMAHGGYALGRHQKRTIFVPYAIPGEIIEARIVEDKGRIAFAEGVRLLDASADRVYPRCSHFGPRRCGRCQWQHIDYAAQVLIKQDVLADQLARVGGFEDADVQPIIPCHVEWGYNYHMTMQVDGGLGFPGVDGGVLQLDECHILHPDLFALYERLDLNTETIKAVKFQLGSDGNHTLIFYVDNEQDAPELTTDLKTSVNLILPDNEPINLIGHSHVRYQVWGRWFRVTAGSDFRANVAQIPALVDLVLNLVNPQPQDSILDLYGGVGVFSAMIAPYVDLVTLVESYPPAATDAEENLTEFENVDIIEGAVADVLPSLHESYTVALLDPPSAGLDLDVIDQLGESDIPRLIYISSDPATLARDAKRLVNKGYRLGQIHPIDFNPQTYFIDAVALFQRH